MLHNCCKIYYRLTLKINSIILITIHDSTLCSWYNHSFVITDNNKTHTASNNINRYDLCWQQQFRMIPSFLFFHRHLVEHVIMVDEEDMSCRLKVLVIMFTCFPNIRFSQKHNTITRKLDIYPEVQYALCIIYHERQHNDYILLCILFIQNDKHTHKNKYKTISE